MNQLVLLLALILAGVAALKLCTRGMRSNFAPKTEASLSPEEVRRRMDENPDLLILDVRSQREYESGHLPGAVCLPLDEIRPDMPVVFDRDREILVCCETGLRSAKAAESLRKLGYTRVFDLGGLRSQPFELTRE